MWGSRKASAQQAVCLQWGASATAWRCCLMMRVLRAAVWWCRLGTTAGALRSSQGQTQQRCVRGAAGIGSKMGVLALPRRRNSRCERQ